MKKQWERASKRAVTEETEFGVILTSKGNDSGYVLAATLIKSDSPYNALAAVAGKCSLHVDDLDLGVVFDPAAGKEGQLLVSQGGSLKYSTIPGGALAPVSNLSAEVGGLEDLLQHAEMMHELVARSQGGLADLSYEFKRLKSMLGSEGEFKEDES